MVLAPVKTTGITAARILIVEDEGIIAGHISSRLERTGYTVVGIAESSEEAFEKIAELNPDLILMDIRIKGAMDGIETTMKLREQFDIPVIFLTAHTDQQTIDRAKMTGAFGFLTKPIHHANLGTAVEMALYKHQAERATRHQRAWMATVLGTMADAMLVVDGERKVQFLNAPAEALTGWTNQEALGQDLEMILPLAYAAPGFESQQIRPASIDAERTGPLPRDLQAKSRGGKWFPLEGEMASSVEAGHRVGAVITFRDGASRQARENEIRQQHKMEAVGRLAAGIAHDFNNLLFVILGFTEELLQSARLGDTEAFALGEVKKAGESAASITQQLLKFSRKDQTGGPGRIERADINLNELIRDTEELFRRVGGPSVRWKFRLDQNVRTVRANRGQVTQVLLNLATNARDALPNGGTVTIETVRVETPRADSYGAAKEEFVALTITDNGCGMSPETAERLFEPFFTTKQPGGGTGLGLSIVHSIISELGGTIQVESEPGNGASFTLYIPVTGAAAPRKTVAVPEPAPDSAEPLTVLLVEDQPGVRKLLRHYLTGASYHVIEAENGAEAIRISDEYEGSIDLLITDIVMPRAGGFEVARELSGRRPQMKVIFISGYAQELVDGLENVPANARFLPKPFVLKELLKNVEDLLERVNRAGISAG